MITLVGKVALKGMPAALAAKIRVTLDGDPMLGLVACDTWQGWVDYFPRDDRGHILILKGKLQVQRRHGAIRCNVMRASADELGWLSHRGLALA